MKQCLRNRLYSLLLLVAGLAPAAAQADLFGGLFAPDAPLQVEIADPYIELRTGAGMGYPVFHVEEQGATIEILKRKTDWFKVRTRRGKEGWVAREQLQRTLTPGGEQLEIRDATQNEFAFHRWEMGAMGGKFEDDDIGTVYGGFFLTPKLSLEASLSKRFAGASDSDMADISINIHPFPEWRFSPFFTVGTGVIKTDFDATLAQESDSTDQLGHAGLGIRVYLARRFIFRAQYKNYVIFESKADDNEEINEWKAGFAVFF